MPSFQNVVLTLVLVAFLYYALRDPELHRRVFSIKENTRPIQTHSFDPRLNVIFIAYKAYLYKAYES